jgi:uncharacterized membrane protein
MPVPQLPPRKGIVHDRRGGVTIIVACSSMMIIGFAAVAVDLGSVFLQERKLQGVADMAAMSAARDLGSANSAAQATANLTNWNGGVTTVTTLGSWSNDSTVAPGSRFVAGGAAGNAVKVKVTAKADLYFASAILGKQQLTITRSATAARAELASFSIGTRLAAVQGGAVNALLSALTGSQISLSVMDYNALASANVDLFSYINALKTHASLTGLSFDKVLSANISTSDQLSGLVDALSSTGQTVAAAALKKIAQASTATANSPLSAVIDLGPYTDQDHVAGASDTSVAVNAFDLAKALLLASNGGRQLQLNVAGAVPGLLNVNVWLAIGQRPTDSSWMGVRENGQSTIIRTAQTRLYVEAQAASILGLLGSQPITLPIYVEAASAQAKLTSLSCPSASANQSMQIAVMPSVGQIAVASLDRTKLNDFTKPMVLSPATLIGINLGLLSTNVTAYSDIVLGGASWQSVSFSRADITAGTTKTVSTNDLASTTISSLIGNLNLGVQVGGLGLSTGAITAPLAPLLNSLGAPLDTLINTLTGVLGVELGQADVQATGLRCKDAALVA